MNKTKIEYLDYTWNPLAMRCTPVGTGCKNCWHLRMAKRLANNPKMLEIERRAYAGETPPVLVVHRLQELYKPRKAARIGVQFMGDLFLESVPDESILHVFDAMANDWTCHHTFLVLTKRPQRMLDWFGEYGQYLPLPLENIWLGISVENQKAADERIPVLLQIPAAVRFVSVEPMLERINAINWLGKCMRCDVHGFVSWVKWTTMKTCGRCMEEMQCDAGSAPMFYREMSGIDWVICGAETGPGHRAMREKWVWDLRDQCVAADVPFFYKARMTSPGQWSRTGKRISMPELDGKVWDQFPEGVR